MRRSEVMSEVERCRRGKGAELERRTTDGRGAEPSDETGASADGAERGEGGPSGGHGC